MGYERVSNRNDSERLEAEIANEFQSNGLVSSTRCKLYETSLYVPRVGGLPERHIVLSDVKHQDKVLLFRVVVAAYNYAFTNEFATISCQQVFNATSHEFIDWLNIAVIANRYNILKEYEAYIFDKRNNHGGASVLLKLKTVFTYAFDDEEFNRSLSIDEQNYLMDLRQTKESPNLNKTQSSLASYFGCLDWLRDEHIGVGSKLYNIFASPKLSVNSLKCLAATVILELYKLKMTLRIFLSERNWILGSFDLRSFKNLKAYQKRKAIGRTIYTILCSYHKASKSDALQDAMLLILLSNCQNNFVGFSQRAITKDGLKEVFCLANGELSNSQLDKIFKVGTSNPLLCISVLQQLSSYSEPLPITPVEVLMFHWLMASLAVQPWEIAKLTKSDFRILKVGEEVVSIECEYFKGRANAVYNTRTLSIKKEDGKALLAYLKQHQSNGLTQGTVPSPFITSGNNSVVGCLYHILGLPNINKAIYDAHQKSGEIPMIMPMALKALIQYGVHSRNVVKNKSLSADSRRVLVAKSASPCPSQLFGLQAIKNSSVHAYSDPYTLDYLINRNSHTNLTERLNYINEDNNAWIDAAGKVTRSVLIDLINNVFDLNFSELTPKEEEKAKIDFNHEFEAITSAISYKSEEMLSRLKIITNQKRGVINEVGVLAIYENFEELFTPIYVLDSPVTVCKMLNYLHEFKLKYRQLLCRNAEYFYRTVLPTVEWVEQVLNELSKDSVSKGTDLFEQAQRSGVTMQVFHSL